MESSSESDAGFILESEKEPVWDDIDEREKNKPKLLGEQDILSEGNFVLVKFNRKKKSIYFIEKIRIVYSRNNFNISFMRKKTENFLFPQLEDISEIPRQEIVALILQSEEMPGTSRTSNYFNFNVDLSDYNVE